MILAGFLVAVGVLAPGLTVAAEPEGPRWAGTVHLGSTRGPVMERGNFTTLEECRAFVEKFAAGRGSSAKQVSEREDAVRFDIPAGGTTGYEAYCQTTR